MKEQDFVEWFGDFLDGVNDDEMYYIGGDENYIKRIITVRKQDSDIAGYKIKLDNGQVFQVSIKEAIKNSV